MPVRSPAVNSAEGDRKVQFSSFSALSRSRNCGPLLGFGLVCHGKAGGGHQPDARGHFKAAGAADDEVADNLRIPGSPDQLADRRIMAGKQASQRRLVHELAFRRGDVGPGRERFRIAGDGGDGMPRRASSALMREPALPDAQRAKEFRTVRPWQVRLQHEARSRTARNRGRDRRRRISDWRRHRAAGSPWKHRGCRRAARS